MALMITGAVVFAVVGLLAPGMDEELAKINARRARAV